MGKKKTVFVYTDSSCRGNPGPGGWCAILKYKGNEKMISGGEDYTTNNRMDLTGVVNALCALKEPCKVIVTCDSRYVVDAVNKGWLAKWETNGWKKAKKRTVKNIDLWEQMLRELDRHEVSFNWIRGHAGHPENEYCDKIAVQESLSRKEKIDNQ